MQLEHSFTVPVAIDDAWRILLDIERVGPCMPGATIDSVNGNDFTGTVKVKLGPINLTYKGKASFVTTDEAAHRAVIDARGRDARGNGTAAAKVTATLSGSGDATAVSVLTDLDITGKPAQFGRGVMVDVGNKLITQFADCLAQTLAQTLAETRTEAPDAAPHVAQHAAPVDDDPADSTDEVAPAADGAADVEPIDLVQSAGPAIAKRLAPVAVAVVMLLLGVRRRRAAGRSAGARVSRRAAVTQPRVRRTSRLSPRRPSPRMPRSR